MTERVIVVGAGVVGLTCAVVLAEEGHEVDVLARDLPLETTSALAGGLWLPYRTAPDGRTAQWARSSLVELSALASGPDGDRAGVRMVTGHLLDRSGRGLPPWAPATADLAPLTAEREPAPGYAEGYRATLPLVHMRRYLAYLGRRLAAAGGTVTRMALGALPARRTVVNCTGLAARSLVPDSSVVPVRGQVVLLSDPGLDQWWVDDQEQDGHLAYVLPHGDHVVVGGTAQEDEWSTTPDPATTRRLLDRARELAPALGRAAVLGERVGLRPGRPDVRLEIAGPTGAPGPDTPGRDTPDTIIHCYGHGGSGVTLSWGCAQEVAGIVSGRLAGV